MTIEEIRNNYAVKQGYDNWFQLLTWRDFDSHEKVQIFLKHENAVIQLIQDELKKNIIEEVNLIDLSTLEVLDEFKIESGDEYFFSNKTDAPKIVVNKESILNTENIK